MAAVAEAESVKIVAWCASEPSITLTASLMATSSVLKTEDPLVSVQDFFMFKEGAYSPQDASPVVGHLEPSV